VKGEGEKKWKVKGRRRKMETGKKEKRGRRKNK